MIDSMSIREAYWEVEKYFCAALDNAMFLNNDLECSRLQRMSKINEFAYFVLYWGQIEDFINDKVSEIDDSAREMSFMSRVQLIMPPKHKYYNDIDQYYSWRCKLAHGNVSKLNGLVISTVFDRMDEIIEEIDNNPLSAEEYFSISFETRRG